jgi:hypothetical protein
MRVLSSHLHDRPIRAGHRGTMSLVLKILVGVVGALVAVSVATGIVAASGAPDPAPRETIVVDTTADEGRAPDPDRRDDTKDRDDEQDDADDDDIDSVRVEPDDLADEREEAVEERQDARQDRLDDRTDDRTDDSSGSGSGDDSDDGGSDDGDD